jgi:hypothetical protein
MHPVFSITTITTITTIAISFVFTIAFPALNLGLLLSFNGGHTFLSFLFFLSLFFY